MRGTADFVAFDGCFRGASRYAVSRLHVWITVGLVPGLLLGCATSKPAGRTVLAGSPTNNVLVLPLNVPMVMPAELDALSPFVWKALEVYLRDQGKDLKTIAFATARTAWITTIKTLREAGGNPSTSGFDEVARSVVTWLAGHAEFDIVIIPSLFIQEANIFGTDASWDGVERALEFEERARGDGKIPVNTVLEGAAPAASLHAVVLDAEGNKLQEAQGGLELLVRVRVIRPPELPYDSGKFEFVTRTDLFSDEKKLREGIGVALSPFLTPIVSGSAE